MLSGGTYSTKPDAPTIGAATATSTTTATVSYTAPAKDGGATITSYTATSSPGSITGTLTQAGSGTITVSGLTTGTAYTFTVTATNSVGTSDASSASNSITTYLAPANTVAPVVSGTATVGQTLSSTTGTWNGIPTPTFGYQWQRAGSNISGATSSTYTLVEADYANTIRCVVTATNAVSAVSANSNATASVAGNAPVNTVAPSVSGTATRGQTLSSTTGTWTGVPTPTFGYQWQRSGSNIGATSSTYTLVTADVGNTIRCVVTATNAVSAVSANSNATGSVAAQVPGAPTSVSATATAYNTASVSFSAPADNGGATITSYSVSGGGSGSGASSPITVTGLSGSTSYTFTVTASNSAGAGPASGASNSITTSAAPPSTIGQSYGGGYYAGSISTSENSVATHYLIVGPRASASATGVSGTDLGKRYKNPYGQHTVDDPGATSVIDGLANSNSINNANHEAAQYCRGLTVGGYSDWYLPAKNELEVLYFNLKPDNGSNYTYTPTGININAVPRRDSSYTAGGAPQRTSATDFQGIPGYPQGPERFQPGYTWSSTQTSNSTALTIHFGFGGYQLSPYKYARLEVRAIRKIAV